MAVFEEKTYGIQCDVCGKTYMNEHTGFSLWVDENTAKEEAQDDYWLIEKGKCYCPDCFDIDPDDNVTIKERKGASDEKIPE